MDSATSADAQKPPALGQTRCQQQGGWRARASCALNLALFLAVTVSFAGAAYRARHRPRDLAFVAAAYYLLALLLCCVAQLELLRADPAAGEAHRRRVVLAVWAVSVALSATFASRVAEAMPLLALKLAVWGVTVIFLGLGFYLLFCCTCRDAELGRDQDSGRPPAKGLHELSPEQMA
ncbi:hypothetical protein BAE44_0021481 [Dichanthelium oligosanthes]|uniref:Uncharacterized protein n=1 Tax=Dichanthelium oligosanthes TaxID=888268 RepID=A0A1E5UXC9_9POAL|nr:hypothetical protein BAE44_0021481 [Dichanthelium oligosanthes]